MRRKRKPIWWYCEVFRRNVYMFIGWREGAAEEWALKNHGVHLMSHGRAHGKTWYIDGNVYVWTENRDMDTIVHECVHAANYIFNDVGHKTEAENDELMAYYIMRLFRLARTGK